MKKLILISILFLIISVQVFSQTQKNYNYSYGSPDEKLKENNTSISAANIQDFIETPYFNSIVNNKLITSGEEYYLIETEEQMSESTISELRLRSKTFYKYDHYFNLIEERYEKGDYLTKIEYSYDDSNNLINYIKIINSGGTGWKNSSRFNWSFDDNNNLLKKLKYYWGNNNWIEEYQQLWKYDSNNNVVEYIKQIGNDSELINSERTVSVYKEELMIEQIHQMWENNTWQNEEKLLYEYDELQNVSEIYVHSWSDSIWTMWSNSIFKYDDNNNNIERTSIWFDMWGWEHRNRHVWIYDTNNNLLEYLTQSWGGDTIWNSLYLKDRYGYNNENLMTYHYTSGRNYMQEEFWEYDQSMNKVNYLFYQNSESGDLWYKEIYKYAEKHVLNINNIAILLDLELPNDTLPYSLKQFNLLEGKSCYFDSLDLPSPYEKYTDKLNIFEGSRFSLDEDAIYEDVSLDIRFMGLDENGNILNPVNNSPLFMFLGIEVTGEQSGVTGVEDFYYLNEGKKARICIPKTEKFDQLLAELGIDENNISFAYIKGGEYIEEGLEWEIKEGSNDEVDSLCLYLDHFSQIVGGKNSLISVENEEENIPAQYSLDQNYPNPFNPTTTIQYAIPANVRSENVKIVVYDILGKLLKTLVNEDRTAGNYEVIFDGSDLSSGIYYYQIKAGDFIQTHKMVLMK